MWVACQDCNLVLYDAGGSIRNAGAAVFASNTYAQLVQAALPCHLTVSGARGGFIAVVDGLGNTVFMRPQLPPLLATSLSSYHTPFFATATQPVVFVASLFTAGIPGGPDGQGLPIAGAVILVNPGDGSPVLMAKTNSSGTAAIEHAYTSLDVFNAAISYRGGSCLCLVSMSFLVAPSVPSLSANSYCLGAQATLHTRQPRRTRLSRLRRRPP